MTLKSDFEWNDEYAKHSFSLKEWPNFMMFFRLDGDMLVTIPSHGVDEDGKPLREQKIRLADLPKHKSVLSSIKLKIQTETDLIKFDTVGGALKAKAE